MTDVQDVSQTAATLAVEQHERVLVVDDEDLVRNLLCEFLRRCDYPILAASTATEAIALFKEQRPSIIVTDICMPGMSGIELLRNIHRQSPETRIVVMTGFGDEAVALDALRAGASNFIKKPIKLEEFLFIIQAHERLLRAQRRQRLPAGCVLNEHRTLSLANDHNLIYAAAYNLTSGLKAFMLRHEVEGVLLALTEAMTNAMEHGNLGIGYEQKSAALKANIYHHLLENRMAEPDLSLRRIAVNYHLSPSEVRISIADEGSGFDWRNVPDPRSPENMMREHGRGLSIMNLFMDEVRYNEAGNEVELVKRLNPVNFDNTFAG